VDNNLIVPQIVKHGVTIWPRDSTARKIQVYSSIIQSSQKDGNNLCVYQLINKYNAVYPYGVILSNDKHEVII
jgi:hypothetical protein